MGSLSPFCFACAGQRKRGVSQGIELFRVARMNQQRQAFRLRVGRKVDAALREHVNRLAPIEVDDPFEHPHRGLQLLVLRRLKGLLVFGNLSQPVVNGVVQNEVQKRAGLRSFDVQRSRGGKEVRGSQLRRLGRSRGGS